MRGLKINDILLLCLLYQLLIFGSCIRRGNLKCNQKFDKCIDPSKISCGNGKYRTMDGSCNNPRNPTLGMAMTAYRRLLPPKYGDNISSVPLTVSGKELPSARLLSYKVFGRQSLPDPDFTLLNMQWGQILAHDTSIRLPYFFPGLKPIPAKVQKCCSTSGKYEVRNTSVACLNIPIPANDPTYSGLECLDFDRSVTDKQQNFPGSECPAPAEQLSGVSHYIDLSFVYGNSIAENQRLRTLSGGLLKTSDPSGKLPPLSKNPKASCARGDPNAPCYTFGDVRGNQNPGLSILQTVWLREHNRLAKELSQLNPRWNDETLFQEARRINIAQFQHITYYEWNPNFYGTYRLMKEGLIYRHHPAAYVNDYSPWTDPRSIQAFQHASFRYFHNQIVGMLQMISEKREVLNNTISLASLIDRPGIMEQGCKYSSFVRGLSTQAAKRTDNNFDIEAAENFIIAGGVFSKELRSWDIQRGRDHGLASYNDYREFCGLRRARSWKDFQDFISYQDVSLLRRLYESYNDVDLSIGGALERHVPRSLVGPTFLCINLMQFRNLRTGDRYWFENENQPNPFTRPQLMEIRKASAARLLCDNGDVRFMQPSAFLQISRRNPLHPCSVLPKVDLRPWTESRRRNF